MTGRPSDSNEGGRFVANPNDQMRAYLAAERQAYTRTGAALESLPDMERALRALHTDNLAGFTQDELAELLARLRTASSMAARAIEAVEGAYVHHDGIDEAAAACTEDLGDAYRNRR